MEQKPLFIVNPAARKCPRNVAERIRWRFPDAEVVFTRRPGHASELASEAFEGPVAPPSLVVSCGGDGTFREVAGAVGTRAKLGILPLGTVNQVGARLLIPSSLDGALALLSRNRFADIYPGFASFDDIAPPRMFFIGVSAGPDAEAVASVNKTLKKLFGPLAYAFAFATSLAAPVRPSIACAVQGSGAGGEFRASQAMVLADGLYGGRLLFSRRLTILSPGLELIHEVGGRLAVVALFFRGLLRLSLEGRRREVERAVTLTLPREGFFQIDGDMVRATTARLTPSGEPLKVCAGVGAAR